MPDENTARSGPPLFDHTKFLEHHFNTPDGVINLVGKYFVPPLRPAVTKWFKRGSVPGEWWPVLLHVIENEAATAFSTNAFYTIGGPGRVDSIFG